MKVTNFVLVSAAAFGVSAPAVCVSLSSVPAQLCEEGGQGLLAYS